MKIIAIDKNGKEVGNPRTIDEKQWKLMQLQFGQNLRWKIKKEKNERKISREASVSVKKD